MQSHQQKNALLASKRSSRTQPVLLFAEDEASTRELLLFITKDIPIKEAIIVKDGYRAVEKHFTNAPDITFLDINMPVMDGLRALHIIKTLDPKAYVVMLSSNSQATNVLKARSSGVSDFIVKPFTKQKVLSCLDKLSS